MKRDRSRAGCRVEPFRNIQRQQVDWLDLMRRQHTIHALLEVDVTGARQSIREFRSKTGEPLSFTAFVVWCVGRAVEADRRMHAYRKGRSHLVVFDEVDVTVPVERTMEGKRVPVPYILRAANKKELTEIHREIRSAQVEEAPQARAVRWLPLWLLLPRFLRRFIWATLLGNPHRRKKVMGTVAVTAVGMFGQGPAWGIPLTLYTLCVTVGGIARRGRSALARSASDGGRAPGGGGPRWRRQAGGAHRGAGVSLADPEHGPRSDRRRSGGTIRCTPQGVDRRRRALAVRPGALAPGAWSYFLEDQQRQVIAQRGDLAQAGFDASRDRFGLQLHQRRQPTEQRLHAGK
jgi:hypothetical protein